MAEGSSAGGFVVVIILILILVIPIVGWYLVTKGVIRMFDKLTSGGSNERFDTVSKSLGGAASRAGTMATGFTGGNRTQPGKYDISFSDHCEF